MKIKEVSTRQFAGVRDKKLTLDDNLNVIIGKNESGKSTMVELIYQMLYTDSQVRKNSKEGKAFLEKYMPAGMDSDMIDGKLVFSTDEGDYSLQKKWGTSAFCELTDPKNNIVGNEQRIREVIDGELIYKKGLYDDVVFASQRSQADVVKHILQKLNDKETTTKQDLVSIIASESMAETSGVAMEDIEKKLKEKVDEYTGKWDFDLDMPEKRRDIDDPWKVGVGTILQDYYEWKRQEDKFRKAEQAEKAIDLYNEQIAENKERLADYTAQKEEYEKYAEALASYQKSEKLKKEYVEKKSKIENNLQNYPVYREKYKEAIALKELLDVQIIVRRYKDVMDAKKNLAMVEEEMKDVREVTIEDETRLVKLGREIANLEAKLSNLNLVANVQKLGDYNIQIRSVATGKEIDITEGSFDINETVEMIIPGVMKMTLAAKGVDVTDVQETAQKLREEQTALLQKYGVADSDELSQKKNAFDKLDKKYSIVKRDYTDALEGEEFSKIEADYEMVKDKAGSIEGIREKVQNLCGTISIEAFLAKQQANFEQIEQEYGKEDTMDAMKQRLSVIEGDIENTEAVVNDVANIPEQFLQIQDGNQYKNDLKQKIMFANEQIEEARNFKLENEKKLGEETAEELRAGVEEKKNIFERCKEEYARWKHIQDVFYATKEAFTGDSTMQDVKDKFAENLAAITDGKVSLQSMDDNMDIRIDSGDNPLKYEILSEGTKDTIALAFRLAMLDHLFPNGGGLVVLDDPFTDMDADRTRQACKMVQDFAYNGNQVIFITCDDKYKNMLQGTVLEM